MHVPSLVIGALSLLTASTTAQQLKLNYYSDHQCKNYKGELKYYWADTMASLGNNCYDYNVSGSMEISDCYAGNWCVCLLYYSKECSGDYASIQYNGYDAKNHEEYNCAYNSGSFNSYRCYSYKS
ncbi:hypothetical protein EK21DRAFT_87585 [Setomelanomma holmii]|uniref:Uncharacterized protein n=1 Tax=Setomelanomma holmii TaxID=210430 RepID=A0A9P4HES5_9PLEO|nr:hypothetical protein EK21DRAFT_87585 [Setomelanomma holmii]